MRADDALTDVVLGLLAKRLKKVARNAKGAAKGKPDEVHDLRVAIRKVRAVTSVLSDATASADALRKAERPLRRLFQALGGVRDHDVMVERVTTLAKRRRVKGKKLTRLLRKLERAGRLVTRKLRRVLSRDDPKEVLAQIARVAEHVAVGSSDSDDRRALVRHYAGSILLRRYESVLAYETVLPGPAAVMHRLRVTIKKLRYAVDVFGDVLGPAAKELDRTLKTATDQLGTLHDHTVAREWMTGFALTCGLEKAVVKVREAEDAGAEVLLSTFDRTWRSIARGHVARVLLQGIATLLGPRSAHDATIALRHAERPN
jgi:CHAD domain-containing protein